MIILLNVRIESSLEHAISDVIQRSQEKEILEITGDMDNEELLGLHYTERRTQLNIFYVL
ncbi:hypothetical protein [Bacillus niameyensis]|uniref:hypothetical protein n=1 Tax=Bacillus niameyensis TaxID=1522308 RepID=UPI000ACFBA42|nr:hypothetical protein [Bacillus niameyensis]